MFNFFKKQKKTDSHTPCDDAKETDLDDNLDDFLDEPESIIKFLNKVREASEPHISVLARKRDQLIYEDEYGDTIFDDWWKEVDKFLNKKLGLECMLLEDELYAINYPLEREDIVFRADDIITDLIYAYEDNQIDNNEFSFDLSDPIAFEKSTAKCFLNHGWNAHVTKGSGDQGSDVIAEKGDVRVVVQCKLYSQPVGNSAVQEVISAREFEKANFAMVVTNNNYTKSARQLADTASVILLNHTQLPDLLRDDNVEFASTDEIRDAQINGDEETELGKIEAAIKQAEDTFDKFENIVDTLDDAGFKQLKILAQDSVDATYNLVYSNAIQSFIASLDSHYTNSEDVTVDEYTTICEVLDIWRDAESIGKIEFEEFRNDLHSWSQKYPDQLNDYESLRDAFDEIAWTSHFGSVNERVVKLSRRMRKLCFSK